MGGQLPDDISYERWIEHVFDHPVLDPKWFFRFDEPEGEEWNSEGSPARTLDYLTRFFTDPAAVRQRFTRPQIDQGLGYIVSPSCSNHMAVLTTRSLPLPERLACIAAMKTLYAKLIAPVYVDDLGH